MTKVCIFLLMTLISFVTATKLNDVTIEAGSIRNSLLEEQVLALLETLRETMVTGSDDIPILDPLQIENLRIDEQLIDIPGTHLLIKRLVVYYLSTFIVDSLSISLSSVILLQYSVQFDAYIPAVVVDADNYDLYISGMGYEIFGRGDGKVDIIEPRVSGSFTFGLWSMTISNVVVEFSLSKFVPQLNGLFYHEGASEFANVFLANLVPELVIFYKDDITAFISPLIQDLANQLLEDVSIGDLFPQFRHITHVKNRKNETVIKI